MYGRIQDISCLLLKNKSVNQVAFCFDLDGTLTKEEILPIIAKEVDLFEEINILTDVTMKGFIPFANSFKLRVRLLSEIAISRIVDIVSLISIDENLKAFIRANKNNCFVVTGNLDVWVKEMVQSNYGCQLYSSIADVKDNKILGIKNILDKGTAIKELRNNYNKIVTVGDGMNDCSMFSEADISIAYGGIHEPADSLVSLSNYVAYNSTTLVNLLNNLKW